MTWILPDNFTSPTKEDIGFLYRIVHIPSGRTYIGRKLFWTKKAFQKNGVRKRKTVESDWRDYWGSSPLLREFVQERGKEEFRREMLILARSKSELSYMETYAILFSGALLRPERYFNEWFSAKITRGHLNKVSAGLSEKVKSIEGLFRL